MFDLLSTVTPSSIKSVGYNCSYIFCVTLQNTYDISQVPRDTANIGWCVPASCTTNDLEMTLNDHLNSSQNILTQHNVTFQGKVHSSFCQKQGEGKTFDMLDGSFW